MASVILNKLIQICRCFSPVTLIVLIIVITFLVMYRRKRSKLVELIDKMPGPSGIPILGNALHVTVEHDDLFARISARSLYGRKQGFYRIWNGWIPYVLISKAEVVEPILASSKHIEKSSDYNYLKPWLGTGLLTSEGKKWHPRRKILTPAFHFKILEDFIDVFNEQSEVLVQKMTREIGQKSFNVFPYITLATLDIICETAMGRKVYAQENSDSDYVKAVYEIGEIVLNRQTNIWLQPDIIFRFTKNYELHKKCIKILHEVSYRVIRERKEEIKKQKMSNNNEVNNNDDLGAKKRLAFLDLLIEASQDGAVLSNDDIREEVDTFMFEGHDTTSAAISWILLLIGSNQEIQNKIVEEIDAVMGGDRERLPTMKELLEMKYLECTIKEGLRLYPSVPMIARHLHEDVHIDGYTIPAGTRAVIVTYAVHRDPYVFPRPEIFNPDRFLPENCHGRHPYAYIPFSAGPRNCIGQKFAILEEKSIISAILRNFVVEAVDRRENVTLLGELVLRPKDGLHLRVTKRDASL